MAFLTTNPNPYILNLPALQNVASSALGPGTSNMTSSVSQYFNTANASLAINTINQFTTSLSFITITTGLNLAYGYGLSMNGTTIVTSNSLNGGSYLALQVGGMEYARLTGGNIGIATATPAAALDVNGSVIIRGTLDVNGIHYPSDPLLKTDIRPYKPSNLPEAVKFRWKDSGKEDIGVLADNVVAIEPLCTGTSVGGTLTVDYPKLVVLCIAEIADLKQRIKDLEKSSVSHL